MPVVSIIIPTFNSAVTIERCLKSIYNQVFQDFELLMIDGGSTDKTLEIAYGYRSESRFITIISERDNGTYDAMNKGITGSQGKWLYFLGSDDWLYNNLVLHDVFSVPENMNYDILYGDVFRTGLGYIYDGVFTGKKLLKRNISHQAIFYKREVFSKTGLFNIKYRILSDWDHNFKWFYNPSISKKYIHVVIANFTDEGVSGNKVDEIFQSDKFLNVYHYAYQFLDNDMKLGIIKLVIYSFRVRKKYMRAAGFLASFIGKQMKLTFQRKIISA